MNDIELEIQTERNVVLLEIAKQQIIANQLAFAQLLPPGLKRDALIELIEEALS